MIRPVLAALSAASLLLAGCTGDAPPRRTASPSASPSLSPSPTPSPAPSPVDPTLVVALGDWGMRGEAVHQVAALVAGLPADAIVTTGDNAYQRGKPEEAAFAGGIMRRMSRGSARVLATLGNHDIGTAGGTHVMRQLGMREPWYTATVGPVEFVLLDSNRPGSAAQLAFLDRVLARRRTPFRVVAFHHPPMSCSFHKPNSSVIEHWLPRLRGRVDLVLAGHNHSYERFSAAGGTPYVTTGGGGAQLYPSLRAKCAGPGRMVAIRTVHHVVTLTATPESLRVDAVGLDGRAFDTFVLRPRS